MRFRFWLWLIRVIGVIVPRRLRADWRQEWEAELRHRETLLASWDRLRWRAKLDLLWSSLGALRDALLLACVGLYGVVAYAASRRTQEIGIRMALGARKWDVIGLVMRETMLLVVVGLLIGLAAATATTRLIAGLLFGLTATDPLTMALATLLLITVAALAGWLPARRASRVDPMAALRRE